MNTGKLFAPNDYSSAFHEGALLINGRNEMNARKRPTPAALQKQCDAWNKKNPVGTMVSYEEIVGYGETHRGASNSEAQVLSGHSAVIWIDGKSGCVCLEHCKPVAP